MNCGPPPSRSNNRCSAASDVVEAFIHVSVNYYNVSASYLTAPGTACDAMLLNTGVAVRSQNMHGDVGYAREAEQEVVYVLSDEKAHLNTNNTQLPYIQARSEAQFFDVWGR